MTLIKVKDDNNCFRDTKTNAIIIDDVDAYRSYISTKAIKQKRKEAQKTLRR